MKFIHTIVFVCLLAVSASAQVVQGPPVPQTPVVTQQDEQAFLQGQLDAQQAATVGTRLNSYCDGWATVLNGPYYPGLAAPNACNQFWTFVSVYGPNFWYPGVYVGIYAGFYARFGYFQTYGWHNYPQYGRPGGVGAPAYRGNGNGVVGHAAPMAPRGGSGGSRSSGGHGHRG